MQLVRQGSKTDYNYKEFYFNSLKGESQNDINTNGASEGSVAYDIGTCTIYLLDVEKKWIK